MVRDDPGHDVVGDGSQQPVTSRRRFHWRTVGALQVAFFVASLVASEATSAVEGSPQPVAKPWDVVVYGATPAGITSAIAAAREKLRVALLEPTDRVGGMMSSGLGVSDVGSRAAVGGLALEFFRRMGTAYHVPGDKAAWNVTPGAAQRTFIEMLAAADVSVFTGERLRQRDGVLVRDHRITSITTERGTTFAARVFIDASYEGDLMAQAGVSFVVGREASSRYGESLAGVRPPEAVFPTIKATTLSGSLAPGVDGQAVGAIGSADGRIQPYTFRLCVTKDLANRVAFFKPSAYDPSRYLLLQRRLDAMVHLGRTPTLARVVTITSLPNGKADLNGGGGLSTDLLGGSLGYPTDSYAQRQAIWLAQYRYEAGLLHYLTTDPAVPPSLQREANQWGLCADEFTGTAHWPSQLYIREARRMVSDLVLTQREVTGDVRQPDAIGLASYHIDAHPVRLVAGEG